MLVFQTVTKVSPIYGNTIRKEPTNVNTMVIADLKKKFLTLFQVKPPSAWKKSDVEREILKRLCPPGLEKVIDTVGTVPQLKTAPCQSFCERERGKEVKIYELHPPCKAIQW